MSNTKAEGEERKFILDMLTKRVWLKSECDESMLVAFPKRYIAVFLSEKIVASVDEGKGDEKDKAVEVKWRKFYEQEMTLMQEAIDRAAVIMNGQQQEIERLNGLLSESVELLNDVFHEREPALEIGRKIISFKKQNNL